MKHISEFLQYRRHQLEERRRQLSLFAPPKEKGSGEWGLFNAVRGDRIDGYAVRMPKQAVVVAEPHHVLRITYPRVRTAWGA